MKHDHDITAATPTLAETLAETPHESATKHVTGRADYTDDLVLPEGALHAYLGLSTVAHGRIRSMDLDAVRVAPGVIDVLTAADIPGHNDVSPVQKEDDPIFAESEVMFHGQPIFAVVAETRDQARRAAVLAKVDYEDLPLVLDPLSARDAGSLVQPGMTLRRGEPEAALAAAPRRIDGRMVIGGQDHFYLEGQIALAIPGEDDEVTIFTSTQHPTEVQHMVAHALGVPAHAVVVNVRRMGGGFGGKETQMNLFCCVAAIAAKKWHRAVKLRPDRDDDMIATGKRHDFRIQYRIGADAAGKLVGADFVHLARCGWSADLSLPVCDRAMLHADKAVEEFEIARNIKEVRSQVNRLVNCETANLQKAVDAAGRQLHDIEVLQRQEGGLAALPERLRETAEARLEEPGVSIVELGEMLGVSKSGVNHRLRKLHALAAAAEKAEEKEGDCTI